MAVDAYGLPIDFEITGGEVHDCKTMENTFNRGISSRVAGSV